MAKLELFPAKEFTLTLEDGTEVKGKFGTWALKRFGEKKGVTLLSELITMFVKEKKEKDKDGNVQYDLSLPDIIDFILCAIEYSCRLTNDKFFINDMLLCKWADDCNEPGVLMKLYSHSVSTDQKKTDEQENP